MAEPLHIPTGVGSILEEGRNCWRRANARRAAFLIDADPYFEALAEAAAQAREAVYILGWDLDSRVRLSRRRTRLRDGIDGHAELQAFLDRLVRTRTSLHVYVNTWDYHVLYLRERESFQYLKLGLLTHPRVHFLQDGVHRFGASHHQKVVVIDDALAFAGGLDLTFGRWDTCEHRGVDPRRVDASGRPVRPFHDAQMAVDGPAARALGELFRERWRNATGVSLAAPCAGSDPWPRALQVDVQDVEVAISRTDSTAADLPAVREVERLWLDSIAAARRSIYIENQYLTSRRIADALARRLREPDGPEVVLVTPREQCDWLEEGTMGVLRAGFLNALVRADSRRRLRVYYPVVPGLAGECLNVHSKLAVFDDALARIGSANLSKRSMELDTECDLAIDAGDRPDVGSAIAGLRHRLLAEHLGVAPDHVREVEARCGGLVAAIEALRGGARTLEVLDWRRHGWIEEAIGEVVFHDEVLPGHGLDRHYGTASERAPERARSSLLRAAPTLLGAMAWRLRARSRRAGSAFERLLIAAATAAALTAAFTVTARAAGARDAFSRRNDPSRRRWPRRAPSASF